MSHSKSNSSNHNLVADELVTDGFDDLGLFPDHVTIIRSFTKDVKDSFTRRNLFRTGAACIYNLFHHGLNGIRDIQSINDVPGGRGPTEMWGRGEGSGVGGTDFNRAMKSALADMPKGSGDYVLIFTDDEPVEGSVPSLDEIRGRAYA